MDHTGSGWGGRNKSPDEKSVFGSKRVKKKQTNEKFE